MPPTSTICSSSRSTRTNYSDCWTRLPAADGRKGSDMGRETFGSRLRSLRERAGMSQARLAETVGTSEGEISAWERDAALPEEVALVDRLVAVLGVSTV